MKNIALIAILAVALSGCGRFDRWVAGTTGQPVETCVDGVTYLQFTSGSTVKVDREGKPVPCGN
jgi:hypothetical protein